ncbi:uncharacterized protein RHOBADRAFT_45787 [Rhodotorula graminis WP1]|uniref:F-box domain-containing protein n=1 Tax=Rhodotorula graminis (strain WP1) TaxID=578459 RepID=A0A0P9IUQ7_RHOGW|nr:uncharacterized protein RHOBADRAFT_45787 [Rhodotorula graminis WP1]KPV73219.1 hypothetical protein RHOBADRAFT_45787 [Rhodotorula graminis WP1]
MAPTLPLELQLFVIDLALPPLTRKSLAELSELMKTWTLVDRAWHAYLVAKVPVVPRLVLREDERDVAAFERFREVVEAAGRVVEHCELDMRRWKGEILEGHHLKNALRRYKTAWVDLPWTPCTWPLEHLAGLTRLSMNDDLHEEPPTLATSVNARLEHVALTCVDLADVDLSGAHIKSILFNKCYRIDSQIFSAGFPSLEVLGISCALSPSFVEANLEHIRQACAASNTVFTVIEAPEDDSAFDLEAWALSVGG